MSANGNGALPRRALHVMRMAGAAGAENHLRALLPQLRAQGWECDVLMPCPSPPSNEVRALARELAQPGTHVTLVPMRADLDPRLVGALARRLRSGRYTVVHSHLVHADWHAALASLLAPGVPLVSSKHNHDPFRRGLAFRAVESAALRRCEAVIAISEDLRDFTLELSPPPCGVETVHSGLEPAGAGDRAETGRPELLTVARLVRQKGLDVLIHAMSAVVREVPEARLRIAGEGKDRPGLEELIRRLGLEGSVVLLGHRTDVPDLMRSAWMLVHAARWEGFGLVFLEAMGQGLPVVATRVGAIPEIVAHRETGLLVEPEDPDALAGALLEMLRDGELRQRCGEAGRARLAEAFSPARMGAATAAIYERAAATVTG